MIDSATNIVSNLFFRRLWVAILVMIYILVFDWMYISWLSEHFAYISFEYHKPGTALLIVSHIIAWLPALWIPVKLNRPSILTYWLIFMMTYIPAVLMPTYIRLNNESDLFILVFSFFIGMLIIGTGYYLPLLKIKSIQISRSAFLKTLYAIIIVLAIYICYIFKGKMRLVGLDDIYELRFANESLAQSTFVNYAIMALGNCFLPMIMALGLVRKKYLLIFLSVAGQIFLYSTEGAKTNLFATVVMVLIFLLIRNNNRDFGIKLLYCFIAIIGGVNTLALLTDSNPSPIIFTIASILFMRTIGIGGVITAQYYFFFNNHPRTYFSHIGVVGKFVQYPYGTQSVGRVIGYSFMGDPLLNSNGNFWATDGLAACGAVGIIIVSVICLLVFWMLDSFAAKHNVVFTALSTIIIAMALLNISIFTTLLSGGLGFMMLLFYLMPKEQEVC